MIPETSRPRLGLSRPLKKGRACMNCRFLKMKCDGVKPTCGPSRRYLKEDDYEYLDGSTRSRTQILEETATLLETQPLMPTTKDASLPEIQDVKTEPEAPLHWIWTLVAMIFTFGIPAFHASLATITSGTMIDLKAVVPAWKGVRHLDTVLLATFLTASFKESAQVNPVYWFLVTCSLLQALMGLVCSTILIIIFLGGHNEYKYSSANEDHLRLLCWSLWDHFSLPAISTVWSILMFMIALIVDALWSNEARNYSGQDHLDTYFTAAKVALFLVLCFTAARFGIFMFQLRRISQALYQAARAESA